MFQKLKALFNSKVQSAHDKKDYIDLLDKFIVRLSYKKVIEIKQKHTKGILTPQELKRGLTFEKVILTENDKLLIRQSDYSPIEYILYILKEQQYYEEIVLIGMMFLVGDRNEVGLYRPGLDPTTLSFRRILFFFCIGLIETDNKELCKVYIELLQQFVILKPNEDNPPQELIDKIGFRAHSKFR
jgi:hypothetical protein